MEIHFRGIIYEPKKADYRSLRKLPNIKVLEFFHPSQNSTSRIIAPLSKDKLNS